MPGKRYPRTARLNEVILEVIATELERMSDPRLEMVTITGVEVTGYLSSATVYFSALDSPDAGVALTSAAPHLRGVVGHGMRVRQVPKLTFVPDPAIATGQRIEQLLREGGRRHDTIDDE
jgi:ribosome-binding factor A